MNDTVFKKAEKTKWKCGNCGYVHEGEEAPDLCPACIHPQAHFELFTEPYQKGIKMKKPRFLAGLFYYVIFQLTSDVQ